MKYNSLARIAASSVLALALGASLAGCGGTSEGAQPQLAEEQQATKTLASVDATVYDAAGNKLLLSEIAGGKPLVINLWTSWCPNCVAEMPEFLKICQKYQDRVAFAFLDVADGEDENPEFITGWLEEYGLADLPVYYDTDLAASQSLGLQAYPTTVVFDANGQQVDYQVGTIDPDAFSGMLNTLVSAS